MRFPVILGLAVFVGMAIASGGRIVTPPALPRVSLVLPAGLPSENVQINYFMLGPFGGYGGFVRTVPGRAAYEIDASVEGVPAGRIKIVAYLPGCEIVTLDLTLQGPRLEQQLGCKPLGSVALHGQIFPVSITQQEPCEIEVLYLPMWSHRFFGISDGAVRTFRVATAFPDGNGRFHVNLPDLSKQKLGNGVFQFVLRQATKKNIIAFLEPSTPDLSSHGFLKVSSSYEPSVEFQAERR